MKKILFLNLLFLSTLFASENRESNESYNWSISYNDLEQSLNQKFDPLSMANLLLRKYNICDIIKLPGYENLPDDLKELIAKQWYKNNAERIDHWILTKIPITILPGNTKDTFSIAISPNGDIVAGSKDGVLNAWNSNGQLKPNLSHNAPPIHPIYSNARHTINDLAILSNGDIVEAIQSGIPEAGYQVAKIWDSNTGQLKLQVPSFNALAILPNDDIVTGSRDEAYISDSNTGQLKFVLSGNTNWIKSIAVSPNGDIVIRSDDRTVRIWDSNNGQLKHTLSSHISPIDSSAILPNGDIVTGSRSSNDAYIWDSNSGQLKLILSGHDAPVISIAILPNGNIVTGSADKTAKIWDSNTGTLKTTLSGHISPIYSIIILPYGDIITGSSVLNNSNTKIWNSDTGRLKTTLYDHEIYLVKALPNGDFVTASGNTVKIWKISENFEKLWGPNLDQITLETLCLVEEKLNEDFKPYEPTCATCALL